MQINRISATPIQKRQTPQSQPNFNGLIIIPIKDADHGKAIFKRIFVDTDIWENMKILANATKMLSGTYENRYAFITKLERGGQGVIAFLKGNKEHGSKIVEKPLTEEIATIQEMPEKYLAAFTDSKCGKQTVTETSIIKQLTKGNIPFIYKDFREEDHNLLISQTPKYRDAVEALFKKS